MVTPYPKQTQVCGGDACASSYQKRSNRFDQQTPQIEIVADAVVLVRQQTGDTAVIARRQWSPRIQSRRKSVAVTRAPPGSRNEANALTRKRRQSIAWLTLLCWFICGPAGVHAATNSALGGIDGINNGTLTGGDGTGTAQIVLNSVQLALVKEARDMAGTVLASGANVSPGQDIYFVLYVDNITDFIAYRFTIEDALNETQFTYVPNSLETTTVASGSNAAARWAGVWTPLTDAVGGPDDQASVLDTGGPAGLDHVAIGEVTGQVNAPLDIPAQTQWAIRFRVTVN